MIETRTFKRDVPAIELDNRLDQRQAEPHPSRAPAAPFIAAVKAFKDMGKILRRDAVPCVGDRDQQRILGRLNTADHRAACWGVVDRVGEQIAQHHAQVVGAGLYFGDIARCF